jgi:two-component system, NtrC family, sensor kinase
MESKLEDVDINNLLAEVLKFYTRPAKVKNVAILEQFDKNVGRIRTDPSQIQQVIFNLIDNALYFLSHDKTGGEIVVRTERLERNILIIIGDNGPGMKPDVKEKIFDPFFTTKPVGEGTGLGLAICYGIVKKLGGEINVDTKEDKGTTFIIQLPITKPEGGD